MKALGRMSHLHNATHEDNRKANVSHLCMKLHESAGNNVAFETVTS